MRLPRINGQGLVYKNHITEHEKRNYNPTKTYPLQ